MTARRRPEWTCEAGVGWRTDYAGKPVVDLCGEPAKVYGWVALCDEHKHLPKLTRRG